MNVKKGFISRLSAWLDSHKACVNFAVLFISVFSLFLYLSLQINDSISMPFQIMSAIADASVFTLPLLFLRNRWQYAGAMMPVIIGVMVLANVLYYRIFNDLIPGPLYFKNQVSDPLVLNSAMRSMKASDVVTAVFSFLPLIQLMICGYASTSKRERKMLLLGVGCILVLSYTAVIVGRIRRVRIWNPDSAESAVETIYPYEALDWISYYRGTNFTGYAVRVLSKGLNRHYKLSDKDVDSIESHIRSKSSDRISHPNVKYPDNLVFIVVESLPSRAMDNGDSRHVAPVLSSLMCDSLTVYVKKCRILIELGQSSDAQFIYNTGLLPLRNNIFVTYYAANDYPGLAKALKRASLEVIGEEKTLWSHGLTNKSYGYDGIVDNLVAFDGIVNQDSVILETAFKEISNIRQPFYVFVTTLSMHDPYNTPKVTYKLNPDSLSDLSPEYREYMERFHHFDESLGQFLQHLKEAGLYEKTCIVITGDHNIPDCSSISSLRDDAVPLMILNSPIKSGYATEATQLDVFPTVLDIMGVDDYEYMGVNYKGLGKSIFRQNPGSGPEMPSDRDYEVSEMIIRSK